MNQVISHHYLLVDLKSFSLRIGERKTKEKTDKLHPVVSEVSSFVGNQVYVVAASKK